IGVETAAANGPLDKRAEADGPLGGGSDSAWALRVENVAQPEGRGTLIRPRARRIELQRVRGDDLRADDRHRRGTVSVKEQLGGCRNRRKRGNADEEYGCEDTTTRSTRRAETSRDRSIVPRRGQDSSTHAEQSETGASAKGQRCDS